MTTARQADARPSRVPLSESRVLAAAVEIADREGIDAVTMRRLAEALDVHPTSIYNHLASKDAILDGIGEALLAEANIPADVEDWRDWTRMFAYRIRDIVRAHPGAYLIFTRRPAQGPIATATAEGALDAFRRAGFSALDAANALRGVNLTVYGLALNECPPVASAVVQDMSHLSRETNPRIFEMLDVTPDDPFDIDASNVLWEYVVESLIAGYESRLASGRKKR